MDIIKPGMALGKYILKREIGRGGFAEVFLADDTRLQRQVAIKLLRKDTTNAWEDMKQRIKREGEVLLGFRHPHIVDVLDVGEHSVHGPYYVMEYLQGVSLDELLAQDPLSLLDVFLICQQLCSALHTIHTHGIVYRDLKPQNIFMVEMGTYKLVKLLDFGLALSPDSARMTSDGTVVGTPFYMAPEQIMNTKNITARSDLYAMGILIFRLLTGAFPYKGESHMEILREHCVGTPTLEHKRLDPSLQPSLRWMLERDADKRPHNAIALWEGLRRVLVGLLGVDEQRHQTGDDLPRVMIHTNSFDSSSPDFQFEHTEQIRKDALLNELSVKEEELSRDSDEILFTEPSFK